MSLKTTSVLSDSHSAICEKYCYTAGAHAPGIKQKSITSIEIPLTKVTNGRRY